LEDNQRGESRLAPKNRAGRELLQRIFAPGFFLGRVSRYAAIPLIVALSPGHSDITRFRSGNHLDRAELISNLLRRLTPLTFLIHVQAFRDSLCGELPHVQIFMNDGLNQLSLDVQLLRY
jgi:hypothetical protein